MFSTTASVPPFCWKEPIPSRDYMRENFQHIRKLAQSKKPRTDALRPNFIPGVTKNPKYEHVQSRVAEFLKTGGDGRSVKTQSTQSSTSSSAHSRLAPVKPTTILTRNSRSSEKPSLSTEASKPIWGASIAANARRMSKSTTDLTQKQRPAAATPVRNHSLRRRQPLQLQDESVYNWKFSDASFPLPRSVEGQAETKNPLDRFMHKVEYLPCDGICAEETIPSKEEVGKEDSARSSSSSRTSRGVNTDETRIFQDSSSRRPFMKSVLKESGSGPSNPAGFASTEDFQFVRYSAVRQNEREDSGIEKDFSNLAVEDNNPRSNLTATTNASSQSTNVHRLGTVPSYLKQRKQQWKDEAEAKQEAERNADVPAGHVLMSNAERVETLRTVKENYDTLISKLNRLPVGVDTVRVREEKKQIEENLVKLEQAMKIFSRPRVFVKMDQ